MRTHKPRSRTSRLALLLCCLLLPVGASVARAARGMQAVTGTSEWDRVATLWQTLIAHSSNEIYNASIFQSLAADMYSADSDLSALAGRGALQKPMADYLAHVLHMRYQYLAEITYTTRATSQESEAEASRHAALWVVEHQLSVLRRPLLLRADEELAEAAKSNLAYQLTYLYHVEKLDDEIEQQRRAMKRREEAKEKVDWKAFDAEVVRRQDSLLDAYRQRKLRRVALVNQATPYMVSLTAHEPAPGVAASPGT